MHFCSTCIHKCFSALSALACDRHVEQLCKQEVIANLFCNASVLATLRLSFSSCSSDA